MLGHRLLLAVAAEEEEELRLERVAGAVAVEVGEEGVLVEGLEDGLRLEPLLEQPGQRRLADADDALKRDVGMFAQCCQCIPPGVWLGGAQDTPGWRDVKWRNKE